jgi:hypothetical protein
MRFDLARSSIHYARMHRTTDVMEAVGSPLV